MIDTTTHPKGVTAPGQLSTIPKGVRRIESLDDLAALPPSRSVTLSDMTVEQLKVAFAGLDQAQSQYESLSGMCATLAGLVLKEVKTKLGHGNFLPWLKKNFAKSRQKAAAYMKLSAAFTKCNPKGLHFEQMSLALLDSAQALEGQTLDQNNPLVSQVAKWTKGRTFYQLKHEELENHSPGGKTYDRDGEKGTQKKLTSKQASELLHSISVNTSEHLRTLHDEKAYVVLTDAELDGLVDHLEESLKDVRAWRKLSKTDREAALAEQIAAKQLATR